MARPELIVDGYRIEPLTPDTWEAFAGLAERHNGVWGGCWCIGIHSFRTRRSARSSGTGSSSGRSC